MEIFKRIPQKVSEGFYLHAKHATNENSKKKKKKKNVFCLISESTISKQENIDR